MDAAARSAVTVLVAPAGFGKTTLFASWVNAGRAPARIVYCRFEADGGASVAERAPASAPRMGYARSGGLDDLIDAALHADASTHGPLMLVLDDFHNVAEPTEMERIERLLHRAGETLRIAVLSRVEPPMPLYRWRLSGQLNVISGEQLLFTVDETAASLAARGLRPSLRAVRTLYDLTEGWPAILSLLATSVPAGLDSGQSIVDLVVADHDVSAYLDREVLAPLSDEVRDTLRATAVLEHVSTGLVEALTARRDGARMLATVEAANPLVEYRGGVHRWYRCHPLLRARLLDELHRRSPALLRHLHRAAAGWYVANTLPADAFRHALAGRDWPMATDLLADHWPELLSGSGRAIVVEHQPAAPDEVAGDPTLAMAFAARCRATGNITGMRSFLRIAERARGAAADGWAARLLDGLRLADAQADGDPDRIATAARSLIDAPADGSATGDGARAMALSVIAATRFAAADLDGVEQALREGLPLARRAGLRLGYVTALNQQAVANLLRGRLGAAMHCAQLGIGVALDGGLEQAPEAASAWLVLAQVYLARGLLDEAKYCLDRAMSGGAAADPQISWSVPVVLAVLHNLRGERAEALRIVRAVRDDPGACAPPPIGVAASLLLEADLCIADGQFDAARRLLADALAGAPMPGWTAVVTGKLDLAEGRPDAVAAVQRYTDMSEPLLSVGIEACLVYAQSRWQLGDRGGAFQMVERALCVSSIEGIRRPFLANLPMLRDMLVAHLAHETGYAQTLAEITTWRAAPAEPGRPAETLPESLTSREFAVLRHLGTMQSTAEIASTLNVSINTVKTHVKNVYRKLDVGRRRDAVRRARELGLTGPPVADRGFRTAITASQVPLRA
jgi:LuxR family maltose regulon positive regulatory protein